MEHFDAGGKTPAHEVVLLPSIVRVLAECVEILPQPSKIRRRVVLEMAFDSVTQRAGDHSAPLGIVHPGDEAPGQTDRVFGCFYRLGKSPSSRHRNFPLVQVDHKTKARPETPAFALPQAPDYVLGFAAARWICFDWSANSTRYTFTGQEKSRALSIS